MSKQDFTRGLKRKAAANAVAMVVSVVAILVAVNVIGSGSYGRADLSDGDIHSLSQASMDAVAQMEGLEIRVYASKKLPKALRAPGVDINNVPRLMQQLEDKLAEFKRASNGNLTIANIREDLESQAGALKLIGMRVPGDRAEDEDPEALNRRYYLALSVHYRTVEEVIPVISKPGRFEYDITKVLLRLQAKQSASEVMRDLLDTGKELHEAVENCVSAIKKHQEKKDKKEAEGGIMEQIQESQSDRAGQVGAYLKKISEIDNDCSKVSVLLKKQRDSLTKMDENAAGSRAVSREHLQNLLNKIGAFDGYFGAWVASLINDQRDPNQLSRLSQLLEHSEAGARTAALRVLGSWTQGAEGKPGLKGPAFQEASNLLRKGLSDDNPMVRASAVQVIAASASDPKGAIESALKDKDATVREVALHLATRMRLPLDSAVVEPFLKSPDWNNRRMAVVFLAANKANPALLRPLLNDSNAPVRLQTAYELARTGDVASKEKIQQVLNGLRPGPERDAIQKALDSMPSPEGTTAPAPKGAGNNPGAPPSAAPPKGQRAQVLGRGGVDRLGGMELPDPIQAVQALESLKDDITSTYNALKDSPGKKNVGVLCGHEELCPFKEEGSKIPDELAQAFAQQPFTKKAVDDIRNLEQRLNQHNEAIRQFFLSKGYRLSRVDPGKPVPENVDALLVYGPRKPFSEIQLYDLDQFVMSGKPVVVFLNNYEVVVNQWNDKPPFGLTSNIRSTDTNLDTFLDHFGVINNKDLVMEPGKGNQAKINSVTMLMTNIGALPTNAKYSYPLFPKFEKFSKKDPLVSGRRSVVLPFTSSLSATASAEADGLTVEPLITSTDGAVAKTSEFILDPKRLKDAVQVERVTGPHHVALHVTSTKGASFYAGRTRPERVKEEKKDAPNAPPAKEPKEPKQLDKGAVNLVVVGSNMGFESLNPSRFLHDFNIGKVAQEKVTGLGAAIPYYIRYVNAWGRFIGAQQPIHLGGRGQISQLPGQQTDFWEGNVDFLFGVLDWATGDEGLITIRAKANTERPLKVSSGMSAQMIRWGLIVVLPLLFVLFGVFRQGLRRARRRALAAAHSGE